MLCLEPAVGDDLDEVLRRKRIEEWHREGEVVLDSNLALFEDELLTVQDLFRVSIFYENPEWLSPTMELPIPLKLLMSLELELDAHSATRDWLNKGADLKPRKFMDEAKNHLPHLRIFHQLPKPLS